MRERDIMNAIQLAAPQFGWRVFRNNSGLLKDSRGKHVHFGLCTGSSDLIGWTQRGQFVAIEVKRPKQHPTKPQYAFLDSVQQAGGVAILAHSVDEFLKAVLSYEQQLLKVKT